MQKTVWVTSLQKEKEKTMALLALAKKYGLAPDGHFWVDDIPKMAWQAAAEPICAKSTGLWIISAEKADLESETVRYGLALLALCVQKEKGIGFPIMVVSADEPVALETLPGPLRGAEVFDAKNKSLGAKITARANTPVKQVPADYRINIHANPGYGVWFELGPAQGMVWNGVLAGGSRAEVDAHGVGPAGQLPLKTVLEYPMQGLQLEMGETTYSAWAVQNMIPDHESYYVRFNGIPGTLLFGELPADSSEADFFVMPLA